MRCLGGVLFLFCHAFQVCMVYEQYDLSVITFTVEASLFMRRLFPEVQLLTVLKEMESQND